MTILNFLTLNIHKGFDWTSTKPTLPLLKAVLKEKNPDLIFLQEVEGENQIKSQKTPDWISNQFEYLAEDLWHEKIYSGHAIFDKRHHGNVILSKYPIEDFEIKDISLNPREQRAILYAKIKVKEIFIHCFCVHLNLLHRDRVKQYEDISNYIEKYSDKNSKVILSGDFNDWNQQASKFLTQKLDLEEVYKKTNGNYAKTFPAPLPFFKLDRIYTQNLIAKTAFVLKSKKWKQVSDHLPIHIEFEL